METEFYASRSTFALNGTAPQRKLEKTPITSSTNSTPSYQAPSNTNTSSGSLPADCSLSPEPEPSPPSPQPALDTTASPVNSHTRATSPEPTADPLLPVTSSLPPLTQVHDGFKHVVSPVPAKGRIKHFSRSDLESQDKSNMKESSVQTVLSTTGASWNLRRDNSLDKEDGTQPRKRAKLGAEVEAGQGREKAKPRVTSGASLKVQLAGFARGGASQSSGRSSLSQPSTNNRMEVDETDASSHEKLVNEVEGENEAGTLDDDESMSDEIEDHPTLPVEDEFEGPTMVEISSVSQARKLKKSLSSVRDVIDVDDDDMELEEEEISVVPKTPLGKGVLRNSFAEEKVEVVHTVKGSEEVISLNLDKIVLRWKALAVTNKARQLVPLQNAHSLSQAASTANASTDGSAERELSRVIHKEDFETMEVMGQFNLGFIIARRQKKVQPTGLFLPEDDAVPVVDDLFLIDQHAADEKYNFETLQLTTKIQSQKLFQYVLLLIKYSSD